MQLHFNVLSTDARYQNKNVVVSQKVIDEQKISAVELMKELTLIPETCISVKDVIGEGSSFIDFEPPL